MKLSSGPARIGDIRAAGIDVGLGTDGEKENNNLDLLEEMKFASLLQKVTTLDPTIGDPWDILDMATIGGRPGPRARRRHRLAGAGQAGRHRHRRPAPACTSRRCCTARLQRRRPPRVLRVRRTTSTTCGSTAAALVAGGEVLTRSTTPRRCATGPGRGRGAVRAAGEGAGRASDAGRVSRLLVRAADWCATFDDDDTELARRRRARRGRRDRRGPVSADSTPHGRPGRRRAWPGRSCPGWSTPTSTCTRARAGRCPSWSAALIRPWLAGLGALVKRVVARRRLRSRRGGGGRRGRAHRVAPRRAVTTVADQHYFYPAGATLPYVEATTDAAAEVGVPAPRGRGTLTLGPDPRCCRTSTRWCATARADRRPPRRAPSSWPGSPWRRAASHADRPELFDELAAWPPTTRRTAAHPPLRERRHRGLPRPGTAPRPGSSWSTTGGPGPQTWLAHVCDVPVAELARDRRGRGRRSPTSSRPTCAWAGAWRRCAATSTPGCTVGFGTTGSAWNDGANLLGDLRLALLAHRTTDPDDPCALAHRPRAAARRHPRFGRLPRSPRARSPRRGCAADLAAWDLTTVDRVGMHDPVAGLLLTGLSSQASLVVVEGDVLVEHGVPPHLDVAAIAARARAAVPPLPS